MTYLNLVSKNFHDLKSHLTTHWQDYAKAAVVLTSVGSLVHAVAGKRMALLFGASSIATFPFLKKQICILCRYDLKATSIAAIATSAGGMCFVNPFIAACLMGGVALAILKRDYQLATVAEANQKQLDTLGKDNAALKQTCTDILSHLGKLETTFKTFLGLQDDASQIANGAKSTTTQLNDLNSAVERDLNQVKDKLKTLDDLCGQIQKSQDLVQQMHITGQVEQNLRSMNAELTGRKRELELINQDLKSSRQRLDEVISTLSGLEDKQKAQFQELSRILTALSAHLPFQGGA